MNSITSSAVSSTAPAPFIVGAPRSGTTLLRLMIDAHPDIAIPHETHFLPALLQRGRDEEITAREFADFVVTYFTWRDFHLDADQFRAAIERLLPFTLTDAIRVFYRMYGARFGKMRWGEKTPHYGTIAPEIAALLPEAHFIHLIRDGRDVAVSKRDLWFGPGKEIGAQAEDWVSIVETTRTLGAQCPHYLELHFEALVRAPEETLRRVCDFLQLTFDPAMLRYHERAEDRLAELNGWIEPAVSREQFRLLHGNTSSAPRSDRIGRWRRLMNANELAAFEEIAGGTLLAAGYPLQSERPGGPDRSTSV